MSKYVTEFIGTFFLVFTVGLVVIAKLPVDALAIGSVLMVMVYMGGHISGAHYNPAVTLALFLRGKCDAKDVVPYWAVQMLGGVLAAATARYVTGETFVAAPGEGVTAIQAMVVEVLFTFALVLVILNVATSSKTEGNQYYGLAIGFTITGAAFVGGPISGGAYNPAVGVGSILHSVLAGGGGAQHVWLYLVGPFAGALAALGVFKLQEPSA